MILKVLMPVILPVAVGNACRWTGSEPVMTTIFTLFGAISYFLGPLLTGTGITHAHNGLRVVNAATPGFVWRGFGIFMWAIAFVIAVATFGDY